MSLVDGLQHDAVMTALHARLVLHGERALSDAELLAVVCDSPVLDAQRLLDGEPASLRRGVQPALRMSALLALARRRDQPPTLPVLDHAKAVAALLGPDLGHGEVEELHALALDSRNRLLRRAVVARGAVNQVMATAREVFRPIIVAGATRVIVAHNHPSGDPAPSPEDRELTQRLGVAGDLLGIPLVDHLIVARGAYFSFAEEDELRVSRRGQSR